MLLIYFSTSFAKFQYFHEDVCTTEWFTIDEIIRFSSCFHHLMGGIIKVDDDKIRIDVFNKNE